MKQGRLIAGLDIGTSKICAILGEIKRDHINILSVGRASSTGLRKGVVINIDATVESIRRAVGEAAEAAGVEIRSVYIGIAGGHIKTIESYGVVGVKGGEVRQRDIERSIDAAKAVYVPLDREVLHVIPTEYTVDGQNGILNPVGMSCVRLESKVQIVTGAVSSVQNLVKCCQRAGLDVSDIILEPIASSLSVLSDDEKHHGVILIDIGGGTTDIACYERGVLKYTSVIGIGGQHITNDIAIGLRLPFDEAERVKREHGRALPMKNGSDEIEIMVAGREARKIPRSYVSEIVHPRCEELFEIVRHEINAFRGYEIAAYGVVLTGGSSLLNGIDTLCEANLGMPVRIGVPEGIGGMKGVVRDPSYATGVGLIAYAVGNSGEKMVYSDLFLEVFSRMKKWVRGAAGTMKGNGWLQRAPGMK
ncbi:MAG: cell division protein FtsA [bacterium]